MARTRDARYEAGLEAELVTMPAAKVIAVQGQGAPGSAAFQRAVGALYGVAYTLKFALKPREMRVGALEGLWWVGDDRSWLKVARSKWHWKVLIALPSFVTRAMIERAKRQLAEKRGGDPAAGVLLETFREGRCVQILHVGPYATEPAPLEKMERLMADRGLTRNGPHHEVYLGDPRRAKPEKLRTILRQPVKRAAVRRRPE